MLVLLIVRVVSFEWREKHESPRWRATWAWANTIGSFGAALHLGRGLANLVHGVPLDSSHGFAGDFFDLFSAYTVVAGVAVVALFAVHGATYLTLRTEEDSRACVRGGADGCRCPPRSSGSASSSGPSSSPTTATAGQSSRRRSPAALTAIVLVLAVILTRTGRSGWAFAATGLGAIGFVATIFTGLYPRVLVSGPVFANSLTISNAASGDYALR